MRAFISAFLLMSTGCAGVSLGDAGGKDARRCASQLVDPITDLTQPQPGFSGSPDELLAPATGNWSGTLELSSGEAVPIEIQIAIDAESIRAVRATDSDGSACDPWLTADLSMQIDAGPTLRGKSEGHLTTRVELQIRADWNPLTDFDTTLSAPAFAHEIVRGPALQLGLLLNDDETWRGNWEFVADVQGSSCEGGSEMCTATPTGSGLDYQELGTVVLSRVVGGKDPS